MRFLISCFLSRFSKCAVSYTYDDLSRIVEEKVLANSTKMCYTYDSLGRVTKRTKKNLNNTVLSEESFTYDAAGNVTDAPDSCFAYDTNNRLTAFNGSSVSYDLDGNMLSNGSLSCSYDSANRLVSAGGHTYTYNAEDVRIRNLCPCSEDTTYTYNTNAKLSMLLMKTTCGVVAKYVYGRWLSIDKSISASGRNVHGYNLYAYCFNNPVNFNDEEGEWPKWLEKAAKVVAVAAVVVTAVVVVSVATAGTGGVALAAAGVAFSTACGGLVGGIANEAKGESFINGWAGGAASGLIQSTAGAVFGPAGTIVGGGVGSGVGTVITETLNNRDKPAEERKSAEEIRNSAIKSAAIATVMSTVTAGVGIAVDDAQSANGYNSWAGSLADGVGMAPITAGFGEMIKGFFSCVDDAIVYILS